MMINLELRSCLEESFDGSAKSAFRRTGALRAIMGVMDAPKDVWVSRLGLALKVESVVFMTFWFLAYTVKCKSSAISTCGPIHNLLLACVQLA